MKDKHKFYADFWTAMVVNMNMWNPVLEKLVPQLQNIDQ